VQAVKIVKAKATAKDSNIVLGVLRSSFGYTPSVQVFGFLRPDRFLKPVRSDQHFSSIFIIRKLERLKYKVEIIVIVIIDGRLQFNIHNKMNLNLL